MSRRSAAAAGTRSSPWSGGAWTWLRTPDRRFLVLAILLQLALAMIPLHRSYDRTVFEAAGYLVATGRSPYVPQDLSAVFHAAFFRDFATIGYPPPWPLLLGGIYRATYAIVPNLQLYAVAIKLPTIAAGIGLAYLSGAALHNLGAAPLLVRRAWLAILFNPFVDLRRGDPRPDRPDRRRPRPRGGPARRFRPARPLGGHAGARGLRQAGRRAAAPRRPAGDRRRQPAPCAALRGRGRRRRLRVLRRAIPRPRLGQVATAPGERPVRARGRDVAGHHRPALDRPRRPRGSLVAARPPVDPCARGRGRARAARRA